MFKRRLTHIVVVIISTLHCCLCFISNVCVTMYSLVMSLFSRDLGPHYKLS